MKEWKEEDNQRQKKELEIDKFTHNFKLLDNNLVVIES